MNKSGIYLIVNLENGKIYVGSTNRLKTRKNGHWSKLRNNKHPNQHLQSAWNKYGEDSFEFRIQESCEENKLIEREQYWMDYYKTLDRKLGYNIEKANRIHMSEEVKQKLSIAILEQWNRMTDKDKNDRKEKIRIAMTGNKNSVGKNIGNKHALGYKWTKEQRSKLIKIWADRKLMEATA